MVTVLTRAGDALPYAIAAWLVSTGLFKLARPQRAADAMVHFHLLPAPSRIAARALGALELALALGLFASPLSHTLGLVASVSALSTFVAFTGVLVGPLANGERFDCGCSASAAPIGLHSIVRNAMITVALSCTVVGHLEVVPEYQRSLGLAGSVGLVGVVATIGIGSRILGIASVLQRGSRYERG